MKNIKIIFLCILAIILVSCSNKVTDTRNTGVLANDDVVSSVKQEIDDKENSLLAAEGDVFWTKSGTSWHESYTCSYLSNSKAIYHGTIHEAKLEGKIKPCSRCSSGE
jgi:hypothetical protein